MTTQQIHDKMNDLRNNLSEATIEEYRQLEKQLKAIHLQEKIDNINHEQARKREAARQAWEAEQPTQDITTQGGGLHATKAKKYPKLSAIQYGRFRWEDDRLVTIIINGVSFDMYKKEYKYNEPTKYTRPETFEEFLDLNSIEAEPMTIEKYRAIEQTIEEANATLDKAIEAYKAATKELHQYVYIKLIGQSNKHVYTYFK